MLSRWNHHHRRDRITREYRHTYQINVYHPIGGLIMEPILQKLAEILQTTVDKVTEMYPTLVQEATWYTVIQNAKGFIWGTIIVSLIVSGLAFMVCAPAYSYESAAAEERRKVLAKICKVEAVIGAILFVALTVATIFGPFLYPNINLFTHLFK